LQPTRPTLTLSLAAQDAIVLDNDETRVIPAAAVPLLFKNVLRDVMD
jgi:hypothetical protein